MNALIQVEFDQNTEAQFQWFFKKLQKRFD